MNIKELVYNNRSYRRFYENEFIDKKSLLELIDLARMSPSGGNKQPLKYFISNDAATNEKIFGTLSWGMYLKDYNGPVPGEKPAAYIVVLMDNNISQNISCEHGISVQSILLGAVEKGLGGCIIATVQHDKLKKEIGLSDSLEILLVIALGKPMEKIEIEELKENSDYKYWRDEKGLHHVPKRRLQDIIVNFF